MFGERTGDFGLPVLRSQSERGRADQLIADAVVRAEPPAWRPVLDDRVRIGAVVEERLGQLDLAPQDRGVKRRVPGPGGVRIGALLEQVDPERPVPAVRRYDQRARAGGRDVVDVGARVDEHSGGLDVTVTRGEEQRRRAALRHPEVAPRVGVARGVLQLVRDLRADVQVRAILDQHARDIGVLLGDRPHQRALSALVLGRVDVGATLEKPLDRLEVLYLRNLRGVVPDAVTFSEFDENLRAAFRQETELFVESLIRDDRSVLDLLGADYTFANERLAAHYGIPGV